MKHVIITCFVYTGSSVVPELRANLSDTYAMLLFVLRKTRCAFKHITLITDITPHPDKCKHIYTEYQNYIIDKIKQWGYNFHLPKLTNNQHIWTWNICTYIGKQKNTPVKEVYKELTSGYIPSISADNVIEYLSIFARCSTINTTEGYLNACKSVFSNVMSGDKLLMYYTGHGTRKPNHDTYIDIPRGHQVDYVSGDQLNQLMSIYLPSQTEVVFIFDCCHASGIFNYDYQVLNKGQTSKNSPKNINILVICSSLSKEKSGYYYTQDKQILGSLFTYYFLQMATSNLSFHKILHDIQYKITKHSKRIQQINIQSNYAPYISRGRIPRWLCE